MKTLDVFGIIPATLRKGFGCHTSVCMYVFEVQKGFYEVKYCHVKTLLYNKSFSKDILLLQLFCELTCTLISDGLLLMVLAT